MTPGACVRLTKQARVAFTFDMPGGNAVRGMVVGSPGRLSQWAECADERNRVFVTWDNGREGWLPKVALEVVRRGDE